ncbi:hypothetical protein BGZ70_007634 [Mortierella alpina]|uniref:Uncharacterized protein n=1 Tax=Mortierella alpina TaxID=64518 RepID=A0A9P6J5J4_MORAP|nr:hypothetical protein BGZ70_007634 [Mortierella alpina]
MDRLGYGSAYQRRLQTDMQGFAVYYKTDRITLVHAYDVPCPQKDIICGIENAGLLAVLDVADGFRKLGQIMALLSAAKVMMKRDPAMPLRSVDLSSRAEGSFSREPLRRNRRVKDPEHLERIRTFKEETWELRDLAVPKAGPQPKPWWTCAPGPDFHPRDLVTPGGDLAAPVTLAFVSKAEEFRHIIRTTLDLESDIVTHPLDLSSVYGVRKIPDFIFHGQLMGCGPSLELVARLELPDMLLQLKAGLPAAHLGSDHLAIGAQYRFKD